MSNESEIRSKWMYRGFCLGLLLLRRILRLLLRQDWVIKCTILLKQTIMWIIRSSSRLRSWLNVTILAQTVWSRLKDYDHWWKVYDHSFKKHDFTLSRKVQYFPQNDRNLNSRGTNGVLNAIFPFWAKMKTVITASCDDFSKNFRTWNQDHDF